MPLGLTVLVVNRKPDLTKDWAFRSSDVSHLSLENFESQEKSSCTNFILKILDMGKIEMTSLGNHCLLIVV